MNVMSDGSGAGSAQIKPEKKEVDYDAVLAFLRDRGLRETEHLLQRELNSSATQPRLAGDSNVGPIVDPTKPGVVQPSGEPGSEVTNVLTSYKSDGDPSIYGDAYQDLQKFIESSLDLYRHELALILYPVFVHMYLELVYNGHEDAAKKFVTEFGPMQETFYQEDIKKLSYITKREHMRGSELMENFRTSQFTVRMSRDTYTQLRQQRKFMSDRKHAVVWNIIQEHLYLDVYEGIARNKKQIAATAGGMVGEANRQANRTKVYYGLLREPDVTSFVENMEDEEDETSAANTSATGGVPGDEKPKKKKSKRDYLQALKKQKNDPNAPGPTRMPFPDLKDIDKAERAKALKEMTRRQTLSADVLPSICYYTVMNATSSICVVEISDDSSMAAIGFSNSNVKVWSLSPYKLKALKPSDSLDCIDRDADDVLHRMMDDNSAEQSKMLLGHCGPVYGLSFSPDRTMLLSCSEDGSIRLWSLQTWTCLVVYKGHMFPVWSVKFSSQGYYFVSSGHDKTVRLWTTEQWQCVRIFVGHFSDVDCVAFHPNSNYVASGSSDRSLRLWDCVTGNCVRLMTGHKSPVSTIMFSYDGRFLASGGCDNRVLLWDIAHGHLLGDFCHHTGMITSLVFSRDNNVLASASNDSSISLWNFQRFMGEANLEEVNVTHNPSVQTDSDAFLLASFRTKESPVLGLHFTRRNLLLSLGNQTPPAT